MSAGEPRGSGLSLSFEKKVGPEQAPSLGKALESQASERNLLGEGLKRSKSRRDAAIRLYNCLQLFGNDKATRCKATDSQPTPRLLPERPPRGFSSQLRKARDGLRSGSRADGELKSSTVDEAAL